MLRPHNKVERRKAMPTRNHKKSHPGAFQEETERFADSSLAPQAPQAAEETKGAVAFVEEKAEQATEAVGAGMESLGETIREHKPQAGVLGAAGEAVAQKLETGGRYLEEHGLKGIGEDITNMIRRNPIPTLLIGVG